MGAAVARAPHARGWQGWQGWHPRAGGCEGGWDGFPREAVAVLGMGASLVRIAFIVCWMARWWARSMRWRATRAEREPSLLMGRARARERGGAADGSVDDVPRDVCQVSHPTSLFGKRPVHVIGPVRPSTCTRAPPRLPTCAPSACAWPAWPCRPLLTAPASSASPPQPLETHASRTAMGPLAGSRRSEVCTFGRRPARASGDGAAPVRTIDGVLCL